MRIVHETECGLSYRESILRYMYDIRDISAIYRVYSDYNALCLCCLIS